MKVPTFSIQRAGQKLFTLVSAFPFTAIAFLCFLSILSLVTSLLQSDKQSLPPFLLALFAAFVCALAATSTYKRFHPIAGFLVEAAGLSFFLYYILKLASPNILALDYSYLYDSYMQGKYIPFDKIGLLLYSSVFIFSHTVFLLALLHREKLSLFFLVTAAALSFSIAKESAVQDNSLLIFFLLSLYIILLVYKNKEQKSKQSETKFEASKSDVLKQSAFFLLLTLLPATFIGNQLSHNRTNSIFTALTKKHAIPLKNPFKVSKSGFSQDKSELGEEVILTNEQHLSVVSEQTLHLRGSIFDFYTGRGWTSTNTLYTTLPHSSFERDEKRDAKQVTITHTGLETNVLFTPPHVAIIRSNEGTLTQNRAGEFHIEAVSKVSKPYTILYDNPESGALPKAVPLIKSEFSLYLQLPESLSSQTKSFALRFNKDQEDWDSTIKEIDLFLNDNYTYTTKTEIPPQHEDFVENFLFKTKSGYCNHFASAAVILLRLNNIPARYVEGYVTHQSRLKDGAYIVTADMAHSWCEYLSPDDHSSWKIFDPTPATFYEHRQESYWKHFVHAYNYIDSEVRNRTVDSQEPSVISEKQNSDNKKNIAIDSLLKLAAVSSLLVTLVVLFTLLKLLLAFGLAGNKMRLKFVLLFLSFKKEIESSSSDTPLERLLHLRQGRVKDLSLTICNSYYNSTFSSEDPPLAKSRGLLYSFLLACAKNYGLFKTMLFCALTAICI